MYDRGEAPRAHGRGGHGKPNMNLRRKSRTLVGSSLWIELIQEIFYIESIVFLTMQLSIAPAALRIYRGNKGTSFLYSQFHVFIVMSTIIKIKDVFTGILIYQSGFPKPPGSGLPRPGGGYRSIYITVPRCKPGNRGNRAVIGGTVNPDTSPNGYGIQDLVWQDRKDLTRTVKENSKSRVVFGCSDLTFSLRI
uniref:Transposon protein, putative, unclassified n=1 Tax=Oryza sativa subsp. japonica TaxID=39947 RepID=Q53K77_ORYSJ|nr:hypothetical protein [Oryza sativa Japonica Group]ABF97746.1 transposon protein, putative, unclassified [Oryza sativa Japonica Group]